MQNNVSAKDLRWVREREAIIRDFFRNRLGTRETPQEHAIMLWVYPSLPSVAVHPQPGFEA